MEVVAAALVSAVVGPVLLVLVRWEISRRVGTPNGGGNVIEMLERLLRGQAGQDQRLAKLEQTQHEHETRIAVVEARTEGCPGREQRAG